MTINTRIKKIEEMAKAIANPAKGEAPRNRVLALLQLSTCEATYEYYLRMLWLYDHGYLEKPKTPRFKNHDDRAKYMAAKLKQELTRTEPEPLPDVAIPEADLAKLRRLYQFVPCQDELC